SHDAFPTGGKAAPGCAVSSAPLQFAESPTPYRPNAGRRLSQTTSTRGPPKSLRHPGKSDPAQPQYVVDSERSVGHSHELMLHAGSRHDFSSLAQSTDLILVLRSVRPGRREPAGSQYPPAETTQAAPSRQRSPIARPFDRRGVQTPRALPGLDRIV